MLKDTSTPIPSVLRRAFPDSKILVAIPAFNEGPTIGSVVLKARQFASEVIVIDDGSTDDTAETAALAGAYVISHARNLGKGLAIRTAWLYAREHSPEAFVLLDGDHQHDPRDIPRLVEPILSDRSDLVLGVRWGRTSGMPLSRRIGKRTLDYATAIGGEKRVLTDSQSGYRIFSKKALVSIEPTETGLAIESEMLLEAQEKELRIEEVNVEFLYGVDGSTISPGRHGTSVLGRIVAMVSERRPLFLFGTAGSVLLAAAGLLGLLVVQTFLQTRQLAVGYSLVVVLFGVLGVFSVFTGIVLNALKRLAYSR